MKLLKLENHKKSAMVVKNGKNKTINVREYRWSHLVATCHVSLWVVVRQLSAGPLHTQPQPRMSTNLLFPNHR